MRRVAGAVLRGLLVIGLVILPSLLLPGPEVDQRPVLALLALFAGTLVYVEYRAAYPGLVEFRDAPPYNRIRFLMLLAIVLTLSMAARARGEASPLDDLVAAIAQVCGYAMGFRYGPVAMMQDALVTLGTDPVTARSAAGMAMLVVLLSLGAYVLVLRRNQWPAQNSAFNVWVNLPTFDPNLGGDVVRLLERDARVNLLLGLILPFLLPVLLQALARIFAAVDFTAPQTCIWAVSAWAFLPACLFMRGIALGRIAQMIRARRARAAQTGEREYAPA